MATSTLPGGEVFERRLQFLGGRKRENISMRTGNAAKRALEGFEVLKREHGGRREHGDLLAVAQRFERGSHGDFGLAEADVAAQQAVHGMRRFHVALDLFGGGKLVLGFGELEGVFELALPVGIGREGEAFGHAALRRRASKAHPPCRAFWL